MGGSTRSAPANAATSTAATIRRRCWALDDRILYLHDGRARSLEDVMQKYHNPQQCDRPRRT